MRSLVIEDWLPGEWDPVRQLLIPRQDGLLSRRRACAVPSCLGDGTNKTGPLCRSHANQLAQAGAASAEEWIAAGGPRPLRRYLSLETCRVSDDEGELCPRPSWHRGSASPIAKSGASSASGVRPWRSFWRGLVR